MKLSQSSKPISSPCRTDPFPPPLMSFLRTDTGSRSRTGRYRSSPIFPRKKTVANIETQEPSSPKVTCMGQVRSSKSSGKTPVRCRWIKTVVSFESRRCRSLWKKWGSFFRRKESKFESRNEIEEEEDDEEQKNEERRDRVFVASVSSPPKNALILTRCRSAPHRSSSSIARFWSSAMKSEEKEEEEEEKKENGKGNKSISQKESDNLGLFEKVEIKDGKEEKELRDSLRPLILTRCKSEPAKIGEKALSRS